MLYCYFVLIEVITDIIATLPVNPCPTEQAWSLALLLTHYFATVHAVIDEVVSRALAVAYLSPRDQELRDVLDLFLLRLDLLAVFPSFNLFLLVSHLLFISLVCLHSF